MARVLIVDDDELVREALVSVVASAGHEVDEAANGFHAIACYRARRADIVVMDLIMPEMEGIETIRALRHQDPEARIIAISGGDPKAGHDYLKFAANLGADATLAKPFRAVQLLDCIESLRSC